MISGSLLFRADANVATGTGHAMRCLALAQAWRDAGGRAAFAMAESTPAIQERLLSESCKVLSVPAQTGTQEDAQQTAQLASQYHANWVAVDGYQFAGDYQRTLKAAGFKILLMDDYGHAGHYFADLVLNQNVCADPRLYENREPYTRLLLGSRYCTLRREFSAWREWRREIPPVGHRLLVTMGGSDPENLTTRVIQALPLVKLENLEATIVVGGSNPHIESFDRPAAQPGKRIAVRRNVSNMAELMAWANVAVSAAGSTCWELCLLGLPALLIDVAKNQTALARELDRLGCAIHLGGPRDVAAPKIADRLRSLLQSPEEQRALSQRCRRLVDGKGSARVISAIQGGSLRLRPAQESDSRRLWKWANDPQVRAAAFSAAPIPWEQHARWFASKMKDPSCRILIAEDEQGRAIGQFRVDWRARQDGEIDVSVSHEFRGAGYGSLLIDLGADNAFADASIERLHAFIKPENQASQRAFELAGFSLLGEEIREGHTAIHYVRRRRNRA